MAVTQVFTEAQATLHWSVKVRREIEAVYLCPHCQQWHDVDIQAGNYPTCQTTGKRTVLLGWNEAVKSQ